MNSTIHSQEGEGGGGRGEGQQTREKNEEAGEGGGGQCGQNKTAFFQCYELPIRSCMNTVKCNQQISFAQELPSFHGHDPKMVVKQTTKNK